MKVGGVRQLVIPPHLAYGARGRGKVPRNATLVMIVRLVRVE
jgi:peptidylprolyl isomerase